MSPFFMIYICMKMLMVALVPHHSKAGLEEGQKSQKFIFLWLMPESHFNNKGLLLTGTSATQPCLYFHVGK